MTNSSITSCPCCSGKNYTHCCEPIHNGLKKATTPEELMRSRYAAFAKIEVDYLLATSHPSIRSGFTKTSIKQWASENKWQKLEIIRSNNNKTTGMVEFKAYYKSPTNRNEIHHELSGFEKEQSIWYYKTGEINPKPIAIKRNDPCPCGSGKKYKKCCNQ